MWSKARASRVLALSLAVYVLLVAANEGEFWPASIYPMFSIAGRPWTRALTRDVEAVPDSARWRVTDLDGLPGRPVVLPEIGIDPIDFANFLSKTKSWDEDRVAACGRCSPRTCCGRASSWSTRCGDISPRVTPWSSRPRPSCCSPASGTARNPNLPPAAYARDR